MMGSRCWLHRTLLLEHTHTHTHELHYVAVMTTTSAGDIAVSSWLSAVIELGAQTRRRRRSIRDGITRLISANYTHRNAAQRYTQLIGRHSPPRTRNALLFLRRYRRWPTGEICSVTQKKATTFLLRMNLLIRNAIRQNFVLLLLKNVIIDVAYLISGICTNSPGYCAKTVT